MEGLIICIIAAILLCIDVITVKIFAIVSLGGIVLSGLMAGMYFKFGWLKCWYHDILHWHTPDPNGERRMDACNVYAKCKHCGRDIIRDSQGGWFVGVDIAHEQEDD